MNNNILFLKTKSVSPSLLSYLILFTIMTEQPVQTVKLKQPNSLNSLWKVVLKFLKH